ncbi:hypothetical protein WICPIJ_009612 [Wickerhamomyces pijperi]|uniref:Translocation protein SEC62 n=1 Tax=Wickerhamomyces pijperi TaxID=599730 RepID=A0A9P8TD19_WICPI|nr:hypothetical protein WICPIJ_009612 [Wickerhamomyces pijperi]
MNAQGPPQGMPPPPPPTPEQQKQMELLALNVANFLRNHKLLKQRQGLLQSTTVDFFRFKRASRALLSDEYKTLASNPKNNLPPVTNEDQAKAVFVLLIRAKFVMPAKKLTTVEARQNQLVPKKDKPTLQTLQRAELTPDEYYIWFYKKKSIWDTVMAVGLIVGIFTVILFPLWPMFMRRGVWYLSMGSLGLICAFFGIAFIRLILYIVTYVVASPGIWIFPNLFADVGVVESFIPLYEWDLPKEKKSKSKKSAAPAVTTTAAAATATKASGSQAQPVQTATKRKVTIEEIEE